MKTKIRRKGRMKRKERERERKRVMFCIRAWGWGGKRVSLLEEKYRNNQPRIPRTAQKDLSPVAAAWVTLSMLTYWDQQSGWKGWCGLGHSQPLLWPVQGDHQEAEMGTFAASSTASPCLKLPVTLMEVGQELLHGTQEETEDRSWKATLGSAAGNLQSSAW